MNTIKDNKSSAQSPVRMYGKKQKEHLPEFALAAQLDEFAFNLIDQHKARSTLVPGVIAEIEALMSPLRPEVQYLIAICITDFLNDGRPRWSGIPLLDNQLHIIFRHITIQNNKTVL